MENKKMYAAQNNIIDGVIWKQLLLFFFPIMLGSFFQQFYNTIDAVVVGQFVGKNALAAIGGSAAAIISLIIGFFGGLGSGASVIISRYFGSQDRDGVSKSIHTIYAFSLISSILVTIISYYRYQSHLKLIILLYFQYTFYFLDVLFSISLSLFLP